jgi:hypothetical protein
MYFWKVLRQEANGGARYVGDERYTGSLLARRWVMNALPSGAIAGSWIKVGEDDWSMPVQEYGVELTYIVERWTTAQAESSAR